VDIPFPGPALLLAHPQALALLPGLAPPYDRTLLSLRAQGLPPDVAAALVTQARLRDKARQKLPHFVAVGCLLHPEAYEQASSFRTAEHKSARMAGRLGVDLTAGMGADTFAMAARLGQGVAVEPDPARAALLRYNAGRLGLQNITVVETTAEAFVAEQLADLRPDWVYIDPARRTDAKAKAVALDDCMPHVPTVLPALRAAGCRVLLKLSPLFEVAEVPRQVGPYAELAAVSVDGECKELLVELQGEDSPAGGPFHVAEGIRKGQTFRFGMRADAALYGVPLATDTQAGYLLEPDVAFYKAQLVEPWAQQTVPGARLTGPLGYVLCNALPPGPVVDIPARVMRVVEAGEYQGRALRQLLRERGVRQANISRRNFPFRVDDIRQTLRLDEGGQDYLFFTTLGQRRVMFWCRPATDSPTGG